MSKTTTTPKTEDNALVSVERAAQIVAALESEKAEWPNTYFIVAANQPQRLPEIEERRRLLPGLITAARIALCDARRRQLEERRGALQSSADETRRIAAAADMMVKNAENALRAAMIAAQKAATDAQIMAGQLSSLDTALAQLAQERAKLEAGQ